MLPSFLSKTTSDTRERETSITGLSDSSDMLVESDPWYVEVYQRNLSLTSASAIPFSPVPTKSSSTGPVQGGICGVPTPKILERFNLPLDSSFSYHRIAVNKEAKNSPINSLCSIGFLEINGSPLSANKDRTGQVLNAPVHILRTSLWTESNISRTVSLLQIHIQFSFT